MKPNLYLVGAAKSGTTTIHQMLADHPDIYAGPLKEPHFFASAHLLDAPRAFRKTITLSEEAYRNNYRNAADERYWLDSSVHYLYFADVPQKIARYNSQAKIIMILRHPVDRVYSHYKMLYKMGQTKRAFPAFLQQPTDDIGVDLLKLGLYSEGIERFYAAFPANQILILRFRQLIQDNTALRNQLTDFLQLAAYDSDYRMERENASSLPQNQFLRYLHMDFMPTRWLKRIIPKNAFRRQLGKLIQQHFYVKQDMDDASRALLQQYYATELQRLAQLGVEL